MFVLTSFLWSLWRGAYDTHMHYVESEHHETFGPSVKFPAVTRASMGYFRTLPGPRAICRSTGPILDPKTVFDSPGLELCEYATKYSLKFIHDVKDRVKLNIFYYLSSLASPGKAAVSDLDKADEVAKSMSGISVVNLVPKNSCPKKMCWLVPQSISQSPKIRTPFDQHGI